MGLSTNGYELRRACRRSDAWLIVFILLCLTVVTGCGQKGPPLLPRNQMPPVINNLRLTRQGDMVSLNWSLPRNAASTPYRVAGFFVYRAGSSISEKCDTCPLRFEQIARIPYYPGEAPQYQDTVSPGNIVYYKVTCYTAGGTEGADSNIVSCTVPLKNG